MGFRRRDIETSDAAARDARYRQHRIEHAGRMLVGGIFGGAGHLEHAVSARQRLTDIRAVADMGGRLRKRDLRHGPGLRKRRQRVKPGSAGMRSGVPAAASASARTTTRRASSILKALSPDGLASASAARRRAANSAALGRRADQKRSASRARHGFKATPPSATRASAMTSASMRRAAAAETIAKA